MAGKLSFEGRVAVVTGAGGGLGKEYAKTLAAHGCKVLVNDLGTSTVGSGSSTSPADAVVDEIKEAGGTAAANHDSVTDGEKIIKAAIAAFGRVDILINNAGILRDMSFRKMTFKDWEAVYQVHLRGAFEVTHAAWHHFEKQGYGRVVMVSSPAGLYGNFGQANYGAMKLALVGLTNSLALEGGKRNIKVNVIAPIASSRMMQTVMQDTVLQKLPQRSVANLVTYLCHENCEDTGSIYELGGYWISKVRWQRSKGVRFAEDFGPGDVAEKIDQISDFSEGFDFPPRDGALGIEKALAGPSKL